MSDRRAWRLDLAAGLLLLAGLAVSLAVFTYDPADLPGSVYPPHALPRNLLGRSGALVASELVEALGVAVYPWLAFWLLLACQLGYRRRWAQNSLRLLGWHLLVPCLAVLADRWITPFPTSPAAGVGGTIGSWLSLWLGEQTSPPMGLIAILACTALAVVLAVDVLWKRLLRVLSLAGQGVGWLALIVCRFTLEKARAARRWLSETLGRWKRGVLVRVQAVRAWMNRPRRAFAGSQPPLRTPERADASADLRAAFSAPPPLPLQPEPVEAPAPEAVPPAPAAQEERGEIPITVLDEPAEEAVDFTIPPDEPELEPTDPPRTLYSERERFAAYEVPPVTLLDEVRPFDYAAHEQQLRERATLLEKTFADFGINVRVVGINTGPVITMYEVTLETGLRVSKVTRMADDVALNLRVPSVRMVAPLPGKNAVGIEVPNDQRADVRLREVMHSAGAKAGKCRLPLFLGKDAEGRPLVHDLAEMPHLLIAGTTGTGKSVCLNSVILSLLMTRRPDEVKLILIDPKNGVELEQYGRVPHLMHPIVSDMKKTEAILSWAVDKMEERYDLLRRARVRNIASYNELRPEEILRRVEPDEEERRHVPEKMPYVVLIIDEMADLMMQFKKEVEGHIIRLAQKSRAAGIHLVVATQKPTVDVITGLIKSNLPSRICFKVSNRSDSRVVLDAMGADRLLGRGDMLFLPPGTSNLVRAQGTYASDGEIQKVTSYIESDPCYELELMQLQTKEESEEAEDEGSLLEKLKSRDKLYEQAIEVVIREGRGSVSLLQRALGIGYGRASRLVDFMARDGIVGAYNGSNAREVLFTPQQWAELKSAE